MNRHIESENRATVLSAVSLLERIILAMMYPVVGMLADYGLSYALIFLGALALIFAIVTRVEESHLK